MGIDQTLCGYKLGRYLPSKHAFVGLSGANNMDGLVHIQRFPSTQSPAIDSAVLDVGRTIDGDLVLVSAPAVSKTLETGWLLEAFSVDGTDHDASRPDIMLFERDVKHQSVDVLPSTANPRRPSTFVSGMKLTLESAVRVGRPLLKRGLDLVRYRRRLTLVFAAVGIAVTTVVMLGLGSGDTETLETLDSLQKSAPSLIADGSGVPEVDHGGKGAAGREGEDSSTEEDPIAFALSEVRSGNVTALGALPFGGDKNGPVDGAQVQSQAVLDGRVMSRNGDIVLVEVTVSSAGTKTIATLLLQKVESGWRTRDVFDAES